jgi:hypothetical protein
VYKCNYCQKEFKKETTLNSHHCLQKERFEKKDLEVSKIAFDFWSIWMKKNQNLKNPLFETFINNRFYNVFYEFSDFVLKNYSHSYREFFDYIIEKNIPTTKWKRPETWNSFIKHFVRNENYLDAAKRSIEFILNWCYTNQVELKDFFNKIGDSYLALLLNQGMISPWVVYGSENGLQKIANMAEEQKAYIKNTMDSEYWFQMFNLKKAEFDLIHNLLLEEGL